MDNTLKENLINFFGEKEWEKLKAEDPSLIAFESSSNWQSGFQVAQSFYHNENPLADLTYGLSNAKAQPLNWRSIQAKCWELYRTFGPVNASTNSKADYAAGSGFGADSDNLDIRLYLKDFFYSYRNRLYATLPGWVIRMLGEGELFLLIAFDKEAKATVRVIEPSRIGRDTVNDGLITDPDDVTQTIWYEYYTTTLNGSELEYIPDIRVVFDPSLLAKVDIDRKLSENSWGGNKFKAIGGYNRFILHWKNLTGIPEYKRDISALATVLEAVNLYWNAIKWQLDHKKAQCAYTNVLTFDDTPAGKVAWQIWNRLTDEEKAKSGLTKQLTPGSTIVLMPGLKFDVKAPQLTKITGENQDILNIAGAGARTPQDLWQGQASGATHASLKSSRSPLEMEIENLQYKLGNLVKYEVLRACFFVAAKMGKFPETFEVEEIVDVKKGEPTFKKIKTEPIELVNLSFPDIKFEQQIEGKVNAYLGSQHAGLTSIGVSDSKVAKEMGVDNLNALRREQIKERQKFGEPKPRPLPGQENNTLKSNPEKPATPKQSDKNEEQPK